MTFVKMVLEESFTHLGWTGLFLGRVCCWGWANSQLYINLVIGKLDSFWKSSSIWIGKKYPTYTRKVRLLHGSTLALGNLEAGPLGDEAILKVTCF